MKITFPHLGDTHIAARLLFDEMGIEIVIPEMNSKNILEKGSAISPEEMCLPFKIMAGNLADAFEKGADTVVMPATAGPCRLGEYAELLHSVLKKAGMSYRFIIIESPMQIGIKEFKNRLATIVLGRNVSARKAMFLLCKAGSIIKKMDNLKAKAFELSGRVKNPHECRMILRNCMAQLQNTNKMKEAFRIISHYSKALDQVELKPNKKPVKLLLTGEIYSLADSFANRNIEEKLMGLGVSFSKRVTISWWIRHVLLEVARSGPLKLFFRENLANYAYLPYNIGGYSRETVEEGVICKRDGYDGIVQIFPIGCMPEIVAKSILNKMSAETDIRVLNIIFDEMDGEAGYITRLEAFVDMLERRGECII